jgi:hypothetical protein
MLMGWSIQNNGASGQKSAFEGLVPGGPLPELPTQFCGLLRKDTPEKIEYSGRHLTWTSKSGRFFEWSLYIPDRTPIAGGYYQIICRIDGQDSRSIPDFSDTGVGWGNLLKITNTMDFDDLVLGAMAELSDDGEAPEDITCESVMELSAKLREELSAQ